MTISNQLTKKLLLAALSLSIFGCIGTMAGAEGIILAPGSIDRNNGDTRKEGVKAEPDPLKGYIASYVVWQFRGLATSQVILDLVDGRSVILKQRTITTDMFTGFLKIWEHEIISSKACPKQIEETSPVTDAQCIIGRKNIIRLPQGSRPFDYAYTVEWIEGNTTRTAGPAPLNKNSRMLSKKPLN